MKLCYYRFSSHLRLTLGSNVEVTPSPSQDLCGYVKINNIHGLGSVSFSFQGLTKSVVDQINREAERTGRFDYRPESVFALIHKTHAKQLGL